MENSGNEKYHGITFYSAGSWSFNNCTARNVVYIGVDNSSSSHSDKAKNIFLRLGKGSTCGIDGGFGSPEKKFSICSSKANTKYCLNLHYNAVYYNYFDKSDILNIHKYLMTKNKVK